MINCDQETEREKLEFESLPEFIREPYNSVKNSYVTAPARSERFYEKYREDESILSRPMDTEPRAYGNKSAELETLWPGMTHHDFVHQSKRSPGMYMTIGFITGVAFSLLGFWIISLFNHNEAPAAADANVPANKKIVVATSAAHRAAPPAATPQPVAVSQPAKQVQSPSEDVIPELIIPTVSTYEVQNGDTLAGIALKTYKRVSPRLLDTLCRSNGMSSADVLTLGQKLSLPEYRPIRTQVATRANSVH